MPFTEIKNNKMTLTEIRAELSKIENQTVSNSLEPIQRWFNIAIRLLKKTTYIGLYMEMTNHQDMFEANDGSVSIQMGIWLDAIQIIEDVLAGK